MTKSDSFFLEIALYVKILFQSLLSEFYCSDFYGISQVHAQKVMEVLLKIVERKLLPMSDKAEIDTCSQ